MTRNLIGQTFGRLKVIENLYKSPPRWKCRCECGNTVEVSENHLIQKRIRSCKCLRKEWLVTHNLKQQKNKKSNTKEYITNKTLLSRYGITLKTYQEMHSKQSGKCKLCERENQKLVVDHNHTTGKVRHLLCYKCNIMVGHYEELIRLNLLNKVLEYLKGTQ